ncbi:semaphorin-7A [Molossus molossus]|uniref:Semaphorin-7A n=1 Tax=Molossus molossus TaxID=27622 RepID=A0A7J8K1B4_MOLMO|nr:semaphorin-7A [Molossus molossus]KAF6502531.1 semaphorin 7A (John Milton Hagen blood group) [Molossus molossus]
MSPPPPGCTSLRVPRYRIPGPRARSGLRLRLLLLLFWAAADTQGHPKSGPRISAVWKGRAGKDWVDFGSAEPHTVLFHEQGSDSVWVGGRGKVYLFNFPQGKNASVHTVNIDSTKGSCLGKQDCENYITLLERQGKGLLACGTNARRPSCWNLVNGTVESLGERRGYAPFSPAENSLVLFDGDEVYSTIRKQEYNGKIPRFRRIQGEIELYTSDTVMQNPQFIKATIVHQDQAYDDKIYYFFREDNPDKNPEAPLNVSRVAQLCRGDQGGESSLSVSKWNTFLKAMLVCSDPATNKNFNRLQDVFLLPDPNGQWRDTRVYGVFSNPWNYSAVCVYSLGDIDKVFRTSSLKGYHTGLPTPRPGKCLPDRKPIPTETFQVADSHPEVAQRVEPMGPLKTPLFHSKYHYQKVVVHRMHASHGETFHVLYLTTDRGTIHKVVKSEEWEHSLVFNIMEIQPFHHAATIQAMSLDPDRRKLYVSSQWGVSQVPLDLCDIYGGGCHGCLMARDPYCGWDQGQCVSIYSSQRSVLQSINPAEPHKECPNPKPDEAPLQKVSLARNSRYYLSCPMESRHATYWWRHGEKVEQSCEPGHQSPNCILFIENLTDGHYGHYYCEAQEGSYLHKAQHWQLLSEDEAKAEHLLGCAHALLASLWLGVLPTLALGLLVH